MNDAEWTAFTKRRKASRFRMRFHLSEKDREYIERKRMDTIERHARDFVEKRLSDIDEEKDGKQTPMKGHPVFIAQHATGCCCRSCLEKWHHIPKGRPMTESEVEYTVSVIIRWIQDEIS